MRIDMDFEVKFHLHSKPVNYPSVSYRIGKKILKHHYKTGREHECSVHTAREHDWREAAAVNLRH